MDINTMNKISYGLYVLTAQEGGKDNGCIVNTVQQVTVDPCAVSVAVNKLNYTHDMILRTGRFNVSMLSTACDFDVFKHFGFQSGKDVDKFADYPDAAASENGLKYITKGTNAYFSADVIQTVDLGTHTMFIAKVTEAEILSEEDSLTYAYYHKHVKPQPKAEPVEKKGYRCKVCGYVYEGEELPADFICPWCKHGVEDFEEI